MPLPARIRPFPRFGWKAMTNLHGKIAKPLNFLTSVFVLSNLIDRAQISHNRSVMLDRKSLRLRKYSQLSAIILAGGLPALSGGGALALTADDVLNKMNVEERFAYVSGIVDGLAYARWLRDKPSDVGMQCIYGWYYAEDIGVRRTIQAWFERHVDKPVDALMYVLIKKECGE